MALMRTVAATLLFFFLHAAVFAQQFNAPVVATATGSTGAVVATMAAGRGGLDSKARRNVA